MKQLYKTKKFDNGQIMVTFYPQSEDEQVKIYANYNNYIYDVTSKSQNHVLGEQLYRESGAPVYASCDFEKVLKTYLRRWAYSAKNFYDAQGFYPCI